MASAEVEDGVDSPQAAVPSSLSSECPVTRVALDTAQQVLPREMAMLNPEALQEVALICGHPASTAPELAEPWLPFAEHYVGVLLRPPGGCVLDLDPKAEPSALATRLMLYWRCAVMLHGMPLAQLRGITPKHHDLVTHGLPPPDAPAWELRRALVALNLPWFSQVAKTPGQQRDDRERAEKTRQQRLQKADGDPKTAELPDELSDAAVEPESGGPREGDKEAEEGSRSRKSAADHTYDRGYRKWDGFDVEEALGGLDEAKHLPLKTSAEHVDKDAVEEDELDADLKTSMEQLQSQYAGRIRQAHACKAEGNRHFADRDPAAAVAAYEAGVDAVSDILDNPLLSRELRFTVTQVLTPLHANSAAAHLRLEEWDAAAHSASEALKHDALNSKALYRRGLAHCGRRDFEQAAVDLEAAAAAHPKDAAIQAALQQARAGLAAVQPPPT